MKFKFTYLAAASRRTLFFASLLCSPLVLPVYAVNPVTPTDPGKTSGEDTETSDDEEEPDSDEDSDCDGSDGEKDPDSNNSSRDCPPENQSGNGGGGGGKDCPKKGGSEKDDDDDDDDDDDSDDSDVGCIKEMMPLAIAPNEPGLGVGKLNLYITAANENLASLKFLEFYGLPQMSLTKTGTVGGVTNYDIIQAGSTKMKFAAPNASGAVGNPVGASAYSLARIQHVTAAGSVASKESATLVKQYRAASGACCYPIDGGKVVSYETKAGRNYTFPLSTMEVIRQRPDGSFIINGDYGTGFIRQVKTVAGLLDVVSLTARSYEIRRYAPFQLGAKNGSLWTVSGAPLLTLKIEAPAGTTNRLITTRIVGSRRIVSNYSVAVAGAAETWKKVASCGGFTYEKSLKREVVGSLGPDYIKITRTGGVTATPAGTLPTGGSGCYQRVSDTYKNFPTRTTETFGTGIAKSRERGCVMPPNDPNGVGRVKTGTTSKKATWDADYDPVTARMGRKTSGCVMPPREGGKSIPKKTETYSYENGANISPPPGDFRPRKTKITVGSDANTRICGYRFFDTAKTNGALTETRERSSKTNAVAGDPTNLKQVKTWFGGGQNQGRISQVLGENGTLTRFE